MYFHHFINSCMSRIFVWMILSQGEPKWVSLLFVQVPFPEVEWWSRGNMKFKRKSYSSEFRNRHIMSQELEMNRLSHPSSLPKYLLTNSGELCILNTSGLAGWKGIPLLYPENVGVQDDPRWLPKEQWRRKITRDKISKMFTDVHTRTA